MNNHPEWVRQGDDWPLLNLGNPDCLAWVKTKFGGMIGDWGLDVYRQDFNVFPLSAWRTGEAADRQGINEIKHIMGLYEFWDYLLAQYPNLVIDNCASGGRRIDFETMRRSFVLWRDDYCWVSDPEQCFNYGISMWVPFTGRGTVSTTPYDFRSGMGSFMSLAYNVNDSSIWTPAKNLINQYKPIRHLFQGDYYPLTPYSLANNVWMAWQHDRPELGQGLVQAFRRSASTVTTMTFKLQGLEPAATYTVTSLDGGTTTLTGSYLMNTGLTVYRSTAPASAIITYTKN
jgi:alpha-galactosidase